MAKNGSTSAVKTKEAPVSIASVRDKAIERAERDLIKRDTWLSRGVTDAILVGEDITLADVHRWLKEAVN